jgi:hypothetical protein
MLTELDDLLTHQTFETHDRVFLDDPRWTERFIIEVHDPAGELLLFTGLGIYPNTNYMDGFAICWHDGHQHNMRAGRELDRDRWLLHAGPLRFDIVDPMRMWRLAAADADYGFSFDIAFVRRTQPYQMPTMRIEREGQLLVGYSHFVQAGTYSGWVDVAGRRIDVSGWTGERDRSWGVRPTSARTRTGLHTWLSIQFEDVSIWVWTRDDMKGIQTGLCGATRGVGEHDPPEPVPIVRYEHDLEIEEVGPHRVLRGGRLEIETAAGETIELEVEPLGPVVSLIGGGYGGKHPQGTPKGPLFVDGEIWDLRRPGVFEGVPHSILEHGCRFRWGDRVGSGCFELCIGEHERYGLGRVV